MAGPGVNERVSLWERIADLSQTDSARYKNWKQEIRLVSVIQKSDYEQGA